MYQFPPGATGVSLQIFLRDSTSGEGKTSLRAADGTASYTRANQTATSFPLVDLTSATDPWQAGGFFEIDQVKAKGLYRLDVPDAMVAAGVPFASVATSFALTLDEGVLVMLAAPAAGSGSGAKSFTVTVNNSQTGLPLAGASLWVTTDQAGTNVVAGTVATNAQGQATFLLNAGGYYLWCSDPGFTGGNPTPITVT